MTRAGRAGAAADAFDPAEVYDVFGQAQHSHASHRKMVHALHRRLRETGGSDAFCGAVVQCLHVILAAGKGADDAAGRALRLLLGFVVWAGERDDARGLVTDASPTGRLVEALMAAALDALEARDKGVRVRACQVLVACVSAVDEVSDALWAVFRPRMAERLFDRHAGVRAQAVHAMARLQGLPLTDAGDGVLVRDVMLELLAHDPAAEVRRAALLHVDALPGRPLEAILARARDADAGVRRALFGRKMAEVDARALSIAQRDALLRTGLADRDAGVRRACVEMLFGRWLRVAAGNNLLQLVFSLDVVVNTRVAEAALLTFYEAAPGLFAGVVFPSAFFAHATPETALALRVYAGARPDAAGSMLPPMAELAAHLSTHYAKVVSLSAQLLSLGDSGGSFAGEEGERLAAEIADAEFVVREMCALVVHADADEAGRRALAAVLLDVLSNVETSMAVFGAARDALASISPDRSFLLAAVGPLMQDLVSVSGALDAHGDSASASVSEEVRVAAHVRAVELCASVLAKEGGEYSAAPITSADEDAALVGAVVVPAVNSAYAAVQEAGLRALGLAALRSAALAHDYASLFGDFVRRGGARETRLAALGALLDLGAVHGVSDLGAAAEALADADADVQATAAEGWAKLFLHRVRADADVLSALFQLYVHPATEACARLRQTLAYFFAAYAFSAPANQEALARAALRHVRTPAVAAHLAELTDPRSLIRPPAEHVAAAHAFLAEEGAWAALAEVASSPGARPVLAVALLPRLRLDAGVPPAAVRRILFALGQLIRHCADRPTLTALKRVVAALVEADDPAFVLPPAEVDAMRVRLAGLNLPAPRQQTTNTAPRAPHRHRAPRADAAGLADVMDDIADLLDEADVE